MMKSQAKKSLLVVIGILLIDQLSKYLVKTNMILGEDYHVIGDWFRLHFVENNGMAFGLEFGGEKGKIFLTLFRILAVGAIIWFLNDLIKKKEHPGLIVCVAMILAGAIGNIIDSVFYGVIFTDSHYQVASMFPEGGGYAGWFQGKVVDMLYFPIIDTRLPEWFPIWGGKHFIFFRPVFNIADSSITTGVFTILFFQKRFFKKEESKEPENKEES